MATSNPLPDVDDDVDFYFPYDVDEGLRQELEKAGECYRGGSTQPNYFCILCRTRRPKKQIALSHLIPHSVLKSGGEELHAINVAGQEVGLGNFGYRGYCRSCENMLSEKGEQNFNRLMHDPLVRNNNNAVNVEGDEVGSVYHCALSVWWRIASLHSKLACEKSSEGKRFRTLLEFVRVWLHKPRTSLPWGLQVIFHAFHSDDISHLQRWGLHDVATRVYAGVTRDDGYVARVQMGPLHCLYMFMPCKVKISKSIHIDQGNARSWRPSRTNMVEHMKIIKVQMLQLEARASKRKRHSSEPPVKVPSLDLIPPGTAVITYDKIKFQYHRHICIAVCSSNLGIIHIDLYKPNQMLNNNNPPYQGVAFIPTKDGMHVRLWLKSDSTGMKFKIDKCAPVSCLAEETLQELKEMVATLMVMTLV